MNLTIGEMIKTLDKLPQLATVYFSGNTSRPSRVMSYRGYYQDLAIEPCNTGEVTVSSFRGMLKGAVGSTYRGYKGGDFKMGLNTAVWVSYYGQADQLSVTKIKYDKKQNIVEVVTKKEDF